MTIQIAREKPTAAIDYSFRLAARVLLYAAHSLCLVWPVVQIFCTYDCVQLDFYDFLMLITLKVSGYNLLYYLKG